jgi:hypothetical protein
MITRVVLLLRMPKPPESHSGCPLSSPVLLILLCLLDVTTFPIRTYHSRGVVFRVCIMGQLQIFCESQHIQGLASEKEEYVDRQVQMITRIHGAVFLAYTKPIGSTSKWQKIAMKMAWNSELPKLQKEAAFYEGELKNLQGVGVPQMLGFYRGKVEGTSLGCMLLQYCGDPTFFDLHEQK